MKTTLYLLRQGSSEKNPRPSSPLNALGQRQAESTRDFLAARPFDQCFCAPAVRALQTAAIIAQAHGLEPQTHETLSDIILGESLVDFHGRVRSGIDGLMDQNAGQALMLVASHRVHRAYLGSLLGLAHDQLDGMCLDNCGISIVSRNGDKPVLHTLNASFHLQGLAVRS